MRYNPSNNPLASRASPRTSTQEVGRNGTRPRPGRDRSSGPIPNPLTPLPLRPMNVPFEVTGGPNYKAGPRCLPTKCIPTTHQALGGWRKTQPPTPETQARGRASGRQKKKILVRRKDCFAIHTIGGTLIRRHAAAIASDNFSVTNQRDGRDAVEVSSRPSSRGSALAAGPCGRFHALRAVF